MELQVGVKILLRNKEGKYLLLRRSPEKYPGVARQWDIVGGRIEPGTALLTNLKREVKEETQLDLTGEVRLVAAQDILKVADCHIVRLTYTGDIEGTPLISEESIEYKWFSRNELEKIPEEEIDIYFQELWDQGIFTSLT